MSKRVKDIRYERFKRLLVISFSYNEGCHTFWECLCDCGNKKIVRGNDLKRKKVGSCGCLYKESRKLIRHKHGMTGEKFYNTYNAMKSRCLYKRNNMYHRYGGRGIKVCDRWLESFENFMEDMYDSYVKFSNDVRNCQIDRIDNNGNYEPSNCRWVTPKENSKSRDMSKTKKLTIEKARKIRKMSSEGISRTILGELFLVSVSTIGNVVLNKTYKE